MLIVRTLTELDEARGDAILERFAATGRRPMLGLVPTMGALHAGHQSLLERMTECDVRVASIFVNPLQFGPGEDFERYPKAFDADCAMCEAAGVDILWAPEAEQMYPSGYDTRIKCGALAAQWCGAGRPGHFDGVATVVAKLFCQIRPDRAYFGEKDYQQLCIIRQLSADLNLGVEVIACPTVRAEDGLALSSRNAYLTPEERATAPLLHEALMAMQAAFREGLTEAAALCALGAGKLATAPIIQLEYLGVADPRSLEARTGQARPGDRALLAARIGQARLIDNEEL